VINRGCSTRNDPSCVLDTFTIVKGAIQPVYLKLRSSVTSVAPGGLLPFALELENITSQSQTFAFLLFLELPTGSSFNLLGLPLTLNSLTSGSAEPSFAIPVGAPLGTWTLRAVTAQPGQGVIEIRETSFTVE
jgi:hypothetical protein